MRCSLQTVSYELGYYSKVLTQLLSNKNNPINNFATCFDLVGCGSPSVFCPMKRQGAEGEGRGILPGH